MAGWQDGRMVRIDEKGELSNFSYPDHPAIFSEASIYRMLYYQPTTQNRLYIILTEM